jgi:hypothetical protein
MDVLSLQLLGTIIKIEPMNAVVFDIVTSLNMSYQISSELQLSFGLVNILLL